MILPLEITDLRKTYRGGTVEAVKGMSFTVKPGEIFGLLGPNGAGKTTIISTITTLEKPSSGTVKVFGVDVAKDPMFTKRQIGVVHQEIINSGFFDVEEILTFHSGYYGLRNNKERIHFLLEKLSLYEHRHKKVKQLSGGMKRRLMIAKALVHNPKLLLLDEPTAGVDIRLREDLWKFVQELRNEGMSILLTTHYLEEAQQLCDRVGIINLGSLVVLGDTKAIIREYTHKKIRVLLTEKQPIQSDYLVEVDGKEYCFVVPQNKTVGQFLNEVSIPTAQIADIQIEEGSLEDAFLKLVAKKEPQVSP
ncbi:ABC transporter ATP-binding protein [Bdellovibrio bacteriovorus]|uniref:Putative ATP-binding component of a transport system n=1 Tax=Bdellovibrio bacteriovorus (strain ATCC 15356 / DSM 50701 / NCIMB 9529 / HD100) TaxID=264462 RepID=Q6ML88_BDEBA|nr:ABC transporter ATP-binding protein [Bdellovibrio bacteriovorus]CAE79969.1 putative ATP-binding component of a transport system [Bdellovibrio bacteriovorus HD100]